MAPAASSKSGAGSVPSQSELHARPYQVELLHRAMEENAIVFLGTGAGKTFIAVMMIRELGHQIRDGPKRTIFLVNSVALVAQQAQFLARHTGFQ